MRLNNHEHTDIAEYIGTYVAAPGGGITFVEGALVSAVRHGHWIVLDELNLAPSDVLEALNRLLDDNRELFVPELQQTVRVRSDQCLWLLRASVRMLLPEVLKSSGRHPHL